MGAWRSAAATGVVAALLGLAGCQEPAPRFEAPIVSGVITLPMPDSQRFDAQLSPAGLLGAFSRSNPAISIDAVDDEAGILVAHLPFEAFEAAILGTGVRAFDAVRDGHVLVLGSGFVSVFNPVKPLGLLQLDGETMSELTPHGYTRILGVRNGRLAVVGRGDYHPGLFESAMQVGPGIIQRGRLDILQRERERPAFIRAFAASCEDRHLAGIAQVPMHLYDVGTALTGYFELLGLSCDEVVNLSGDREALLALPSVDGQSIAYFGNPTLPKASVIAFAARPTATR